MSDWDDLAEIVDQPPRIKPLRGRLYKQIQNAKLVNRNTVANRIAISAQQRKPIVTLAKVNLPK